MRLPIFCFGCLALVGCLAARGQFECAGDDACVLGGRYGRCESSGFCSFGDMTCGGSGYRYADYASPALRGRCVDGPELQADGMAADGMGFESADLSDLAPAFSDSSALGDLPSGSLGDMGDADQAVSCGGTAQPCCPGNVCYGVAVCLAGVCG
jgi:hypothetical protein